MPLILGTGSSTGLVTLYPEFDYVEEDQPIDDIHRTKAGVWYRYKWSQYARVRIPVLYLTSAQASMVNTYWSSSTAVRWWWTDDSIVNSGHIVNDAKPIGQRILPYQDLFKGEIILES